MTKWIRQFIIPLIVVAVGFSAARTLVKNRKKPPRKNAQTTAPLVDVTSLSVENVQVEIEAVGTVVPARSIQLAAEVPGRIESVHEQMVDGGFVEKGAVLVRLDDRDYKLAVQQQQAAVAQARFQLKVERSRGRIAEREWNMVQDKRSRTGSNEELALRKPHLKSARASKQAAESGLRRAKLMVERTKVTAPFNAFIQKEQVDVGQLVGPQFPIATLVGTDEFWVQTSIPIDKLSWIAIPRSADGVGSSATVTQETGVKGARPAHQGSVIRLLSDLDPRSRLARLIVRVPDPLEQKVAEKDRKGPLLLGSFVRVAIQGKTLKSVTKIPRRALRDDHQVWIVDAQDTLQIKDVNVIWRSGDFVVVDEQFKDSERLVISTLSPVVSGMKVRVSGSGAPKTQRESNASLKNGDAK